MSTRQWYVSKTCYCEHVEHEIELQTLVRLPSEDLAARPHILASRCSDALDCSGINTPLCAWFRAGTDYSLR